MHREQTHTEESAGADSESEPQRLRLEAVSDRLRAALQQAEPGASGLRSVRAVGPQGQRDIAGLFDGRGFFLELPWPNPRGECRRLDHEPLGVDWEPHCARNRGSRPTH